MSGVSPRRVRGGALAAKLMAVSHERGQLSQDGHLVPSNQLLTAVRLPLGVSDYDSSWQFAFRRRGERKYVPTCDRPLPNYGQIMKRHQQWQSSIS